MHPKAISHRGRGTGMPDNTIEAIKSAINAGFQWIEIDVRETKDNTLVLWHDQHINNVRLETLNIERLQNLGKTQKVKIPTLEQAILSAKGKIKLDIELKEYKNVEQALEIAQYHLKYDDYFFSSFNIFTLIKLRRLDKQVQLGIIFDARGPEQKMKLVKRFTFKKIHRIAQFFNINLLILHHSLLSDRIIRKTEQSRMNLMVWDVNDKQHFKVLADSPAIKGIITDIHVE